MSLIEALSSSGADILEIGLPFSDPIADGPVIQNAMMRSLKGGFKVNDIFNLIKKTRASGIDIPIIVMSYLNPIIRIGGNEFCKKSAESGADGILLVDMPIEESEELDEIVKKHGMDVIRLIAPNTCEARMMEIFSKSTGFVYAVSVSGTTGARDNLSKQSIDFLRRVASIRTCPLAVGFGISSPDHVRQIRAIGVDAVIEGSKLISIYSDYTLSNEERLSRIEEHATEMKRATVD